jgi:hypothetical protein
MIVGELEAEIAAGEACAQDIARSDALEEIRAELEDELRHHQARAKELMRAAIAVDRAHAKKDVDRVRTLLRRTDHESTALRRRIDESFHPYWGSLLKEKSETSSFGDQIEEYACVYTSRVSNFLAYSPLQYFRSRRDLLPHEI